MESPRLLTLLTSLLAAVGALVVLPLTAGVAQGVVEPCTIRYSNPATADIGAAPPGSFSLGWHDIQVSDERIVLDVDFGFDVDVRGDSSAVRFVLTGPQSKDLEPFAEASGTTGPLIGHYELDDEAATPFATNSPAAGRYKPTYPASKLEGQSAAGQWRLLVPNASTSTGTWSNFTLTITYATCDSDGDGVDDSVDNCLTVPNDQANSDDDALGDACDLDIDGDNLANADDGCPTVASANPTGCPSADRNARLRYLKGKNRLQATIASPVAACSAGAKVKLWRVHRRHDLPLVTATAKANGRYRFKVPRGARYYVMVTPSYSSGVAECGKATSRKVLVPRRHRR